MALIPKILGGQYLVGTEIGRGGFGTIHYGKCIKTKTDVAIKFEEQTSENKTLLKEVQVYTALKNAPGFPQLVWHGETGDFTHYCIVLELLGPSLGKLAKNHKTFGLETVCQIGVEVLERLQVLHEANFVHCDLKPDNLAIDLACKKIHLIDFGLSDKLPDSGEPLKTNKAVGSPKFMAIGSHYGIVSFKNDIQSLGFVLIDLLTGSLPWDEEHIYPFIHNKNPTFAQLIKIICEHKETCIDGLLNSLPIQLKLFLNASRTMKHNERPNYTDLREILQKDVTFVRYDYQMDTDP